MSSRSWVRCFLSTALLYTSIVKYQGTHGKCNCVFSLGGNTYNMTSLQSTSGARFEADDSGWSYSFNPCRSFKMGSSGDCQSDVAICRWVEQQSYVKIGTQSSAECGFYKGTRIPRLQYFSDEEGIRWKPVVLLKCDKNEKKGNFKLWKQKGASEFVFNLTHMCACPNFCLIKPPKHTTKEPITPAIPSDPSNNNVVKEAAAGAAGGVCLLIIAAIVVVKRRRRQNDEEQPILHANTVDETRNSFGASANEGGESAAETASSLIGSSVLNKDFNSKRKNAEFPC